MYSISQYEPSARDHQEAAAPESVWTWEKEERARNAIESGYPYRGRNGGRPAFRGANNGMYSKTIEAIWGVDDASYEASLGGEFPHDEDSGRVFRKRPTGVGNPERHLSGRQFVELYSAVSYANHLGIVMNVHVSITWGLLGIHGQDEAAKALRYEFFKHLQEWCEYRMPDGHRFVWLYVHEEGRKHGFHTHLLTAIPDKLRGEFRKWMEKRMSSLSRSGIVPKGTYKIVAPPSDRIGRQWRYLQYLCKGIGGGEELASSVGTEPSVKAASLIRADGGRPVDVRCRKRCGVSNNIGRQARRNGQYESLLERGVTDVRQLYAGMEYLGYLRNQPEVQCADVMPRLLANEILVQEIRAEDSANAIGDAAVRAYRKADLGRQRKAARRLAAQHEEQIALLATLFRR